ncbi:hypothetical protein EG327_009639 [Venturia inaequalis]|uniref:Rhodopsin domain-containing protein n=1 Tax=Venturia inaequalis TaxID=5025 RepID=A0A8H3ZHK5_VENIN|nr:hypothetical protein EG327_009639 [Venturia inaequalis]
MGYITTDNGSLQVLFLINTGSLLSLSTIIVLSRLHCRFSYLQNVGLDDYLTIAALAIAIALGVMNGFHVSLGTGRHVSDLDLEETLIPTLKHWYAYQIVYPWTLFFVKASILAHYHRIFRRTKFCNAVYIVSMFVTVFTLVAFFVNLFECRGNFARAWSPTFPQGCNNIPTTYFSTATINILTDVTILLMPMRAFYQLDVGRRKRWALLGVFMGGGIAVLASIVRLYALWLYSVSQDVFFDAIYILLLSQIEVNMAIISASAPTLLPLFKSAFPSSPSSYNQPGTPYGVDLRDKPEAILFLITPMVVFTKSVNEEEEINYLRKGREVGTRRLPIMYTLTVHLHCNEDPESIVRLKAKLVEAARVYRKDRETADWLVMQDVHDPRSFTIVERFENESSQKYHLENPYWKTFDPYVIPLLDRPMDLRRHEELDTSKDVVVPQ